MQYEFIQPFGHAGRKGLQNRILLKEPRFRLH
jgi:hypothetical protein